MTAETTEGGDRFTGPARLHLEVVAMVADLLDDDRNIKRRIETGRRIESLLEQGIDLPGLAIERIAGLLEGGHAEVVIGEVADQACCGTQCGGLISNGQIGNTGSTMDLGTTEVFRE